MTKDGYKVVLTKSAIRDIKDIKTYILEQFQYRELAENFSTKIRSVVASLDTFSFGYRKLEFQYRGYTIYLKPYKTYLIFYVVDVDKKSVNILRVMQDGMNWQYILEKWINDR